MSKLLALPLIVVLTFVQWIIVFVSLVSEKVINVIVGFVGFLVVICVLTRTMMVVDGLKLAFLLFCLWSLPHAGYWVNDKIRMLKEVLNG